VLDLALNTARGTPWENACRRRHFGMHMDGRSRGAGGRWLGCRVPECLHRRRPAAARTVMGMTASSAAGKCSLNQARPNGDMRCSLSVRSNPLQKLVRTNSIYSRDLDRASGLNQLQFIRYENDFPIRQFSTYELKLSYGNAWTRTSEESRKKTDASFSTAEERVKRPPCLSLPFFLLLQQTELLHRQ
jgi:hypothetical protein